MAKRHVGFYVHEFDLKKGFAAYFFSLPTKLVINEKVILYIKQVNYKKS